MSFEYVCASGVCGHDVPPMVGSILTGVGMTLAQAARATERGEEVGLTDVQQRLVEEWAEQQLGAVAR
ncbi:MAG TPA: hypothetical protein VGM91_05125 [Conexibacter sp.]|jgi:hypothetical protein